MAYLFNMALANTMQEKRILTNQWKDLQAQRIADESSANPNMVNMLAKTINVVNAGLTPADAYREFDSQSKLAQNPIGEFALYGRILAKAEKSVNIGRMAYEYRQVSTTDAGKTSLKGQSGVQIDNTTADYSGTVVPMHDKAFGRGFREIEGMREDGYDALVDDASEADLSLMRTVNNYLWNGSADIVFKGRKWLGIKGGDSSVVNTTYNVAMLSGSATDVYNAVKGLRDTLRIDNNVSGELTLVVSQAIMSAWESPFSTNDQAFGTVKAMIEALEGIGEVVADPALVGEQIAITLISFEGLQAVTGMAKSTTPVTRQVYNSDHNFIKAMAQGFLSKVDKAGKKNTLYATYSA